MHSSQLTPLPDLLDRVANAILYEQEASEIHTYLIGYGLSETAAYYTYIGAKMIACNRLEHTKL